MTTPQIKVAIAKQKRRIFLILEDPGENIRDLAWSAITVRMQFRVAANLWPEIRNG